MTMRWDLFCRVIDNHGDLGVCWRLAADLAGRGEQVRLCVDDAAALDWMAPAGAAGVTVLPWAEPPEVPGDVVVEAFGCDPPAVFVERMQRPRPPVWINLEYLSAEAYVERNHGLRSPQISGLDKWFFYPGFTPQTGGLLHEPGLQARRAAFDAPRWLASQGLERRDGERIVSLFCYDNGALPALLKTLAGAPTLLLLTPGHATRQFEAALGASLQTGLLRAHRLPWFTQPGYDELLWACDLNFVRGEDSFVRAQWAGVPFVWQIYPQDDGVHVTKLDAFLDRHLRGAPADAASDVRRLWLGWNGLGDWPSRWPDFGRWQHRCREWRVAQMALPDLATRLIGFVGEKG